MSADIDNIQLSDWIYRYILENGPCKTSKLRNECDVSAKTVRDCCEMHSGLTSLKVRRCNIWLTPEQILWYEEDILGCIEHGIDNPKDIVKALGSNAFQRDVLTAVIEQMDAEVIA